MEICHFTACEADIDNISDALFKEMMEENLDKSLDFKGIAVGGRRRHLSSSAQQISRRLAAFTLPLDISVEGPASEADLALSYIMEVLEDKEDDIANKLKELDYNAFKDSSVSMEASDPNGNANSNVPTGSRPAAEEQVDLETTEHHVLLDLGNVPSGYKISQQKKSALLRFIKELMDKNLFESFRLVRVADEAIYRDRRLFSSSLEQGSGRRLDTVSLPLSISVEGPAEDSE